MSRYVCTGGNCCSELRKKVEMGKRCEKQLMERAGEESKMLEKPPGSLLSGELASHLVTAPCRSRPEAAGVFPGGRSCVHGSAEGREQWAGSPSYKAVTPRAGDVTERHMQCTWAATHQLFYTVTTATLFVVPRAQAKVTMAPVAVDHSLISELVLGSSYLAGQIQLRLLSWLLQQCVAADSMAGLMVRWSCSRNGVLLQEQPCLCPLELQDCPDHSDCPVHSSKSLIWRLIHV